jgi:pimeloyl-ACP methyl ester carboxylesterase
VILRTDVNKIKKVVLWDPTAGLSPERKKELRYSEELKKYIKGGRTEVLLSEEMVREWEEITDLTKEVKRITIPTKFIFAGMHYSAPLWMEVLKNSTYAETVTITNATHTFMEEGVEEELFAETLDFFRG